jgi:hypothetical protein
MGNKKNAYIILIGKPEGKRPSGRPGSRCEDNIKIDLKEVAYYRENWIRLAQGRNRWWFL